MKQKDLIKNIGTLDSMLNDLKSIKTDQIYDLYAKARIEGGIKYLKDEYKEQLKGN